MSEENKENAINAPGYLLHTIDGCTDAHKQPGVFAMQVPAGVLVTSLGWPSHNGRRRETMYFIPNVQLGERKTRRGMKASIYPPGPLPEGVQPPWDVLEGLEGVQSS